MNGHPEPTLRVVGSTTAPVELTAAGAVVSLKLEPEALDPSLIDRLSQDDSLYLRLEELTGRQPANVEVFLELPDGHLRDSSEHRAGVIGLFGLAQASRVDRSGKPGSGLAFSLDVSQLIVELCREPAALSSGLRVRLSFTRPPRTGAQVLIGKISLLHALRCNEARAR